MRRSRGPRTLLNPNLPLQGNAVAYFDVDGDPESLALRPGETPIVCVMSYMVRRLKDGKVRLAGRLGADTPGAISVDFTGWDGLPATFTTSLKVEARK